MVRLPVRLEHVGIFSYGVYDIKLAQIFFERGLKEIIF